MIDPIGAAGILITLLAMINPVANIPFFVTVTQDETREERRRILIRALLTAGVVLFAFALFGRVIFYAYGLTLPAFRVAGGLLLLKIGFDMVTGRPMTGKRTDVERTEATDRDDIAVVPLGVPVHAGPGAITAVMLIAADVQQTLDWVVLLGSITLVLLFAYLVLVRAHSLFKRMGRSGPLAMSRILGLIITGVGVRLMELGIKEMAF